MDALPPRDTTSSGPDDDNTPHMVSTPAGAPNDGATETASNDGHGGHPTDGVGAADSSDPSAGEADDGAEADDSLAVDDAAAAEAPDDGDALTAACGGPRNAVPPLVREGTAQLDAFQPGEEAEARGDTEMAGDPSWAPTEQEAFAAACVDSARKSLVNGRVDPARLEEDAGGIATAFGRPLDEARRGILSAVQRMMGANPTASDAALAGAQGGAAPRRDWTEIAADEQMRIVAAVEEEAAAQQASSKDAILALVRGLAISLCPDLHYSAPVGALIAERVMRRRQEAKEAAEQADRARALPALEAAIQDAASRLWVDGKKDKVYLRNISREIAQQYSLNPFAVAQRLEEKAAQGAAAPMPDAAAKGTALALLGAQLNAWRLLADPLSEPVLADNAMAEYCFLAVDGGGDNITKDLYVYQNGVYRSRGEETIRAYISRQAEAEAERVFEAVKEKLRKDGVPPALATQQAAQEANKCRQRADEKTTEKVVYRIETARRVPASAMTDPELKYINCLNGLLDWRTGVLHDHTPEYYSATQIPVVYDPTAFPVRFASFLAEVLPIQEDQELLFEWFGYCLLPTTKYQKAMLLKGSGSNGKSKVLDVLTALIGQENTTSASLDDLTSDKFAPSQIVDKLVNVCADLGDKAVVEDSGLFKTITAGDSIQAQKKYGQLFSFRPTCRLMFSANDFPRTSDHTLGYWRRWLLLPFEVFIPKERQDGNLTAKLTTPKEIQGVLNLAIEGLRRLEERGHFVETPSMRGALHAYQAQSDSVVAFLDQEEDQVVIHPQAQVGKEALYHAYSQWCESAHRAPVSRTKFNKTLVEKQPVQEVNRGRNGGRVWVGIGLYASQ